MLTSFGPKDGKYQLVEMEPHVPLIFGGPDAHLFEQVNQPLEPIEEVRFTLTVAYLRKQFPGFLEGKCRCGVPGCKDPASLVRIRK